MQSNHSIHEAQIQQILQEVEVLDYHRYSIKGDIKTVVSHQPHQNNLGAFSDFGKNEFKPEKLDSSKLVAHLQGSLYNKYYCGVPENQELEVLPLKKEREAFMDQLSAANHSLIKTDAGWTIASIDQQGNAMAVKNGVSRSVIPNTYVLSKGYTSFAVGHRIDFMAMKENRNTQAVFYYIYGDAFLSPQSELVRIYWNIQPEGASKLIEQLTQVLNAYRIPFHFKCLNHPDLYNRSDSAVLYFDQSNLHIIKLLIAPIIQLVKPYLVDKTPMFTDALDVGVSIAEDPGNGQSFGMSRVEAIAEGMVEAFKSNITNSTDKIKKVYQALGQKGIDVRRMSRNSFNYPNN